MAPASQLIVTASACPETAEAVAPRLVSRVRNRLPNVATPTACPSWIVVVSTPLASAACRSGTPTSAYVTSGLKPKASAAPVTISPACNGNPPGPPERRTEATAR
jgi:hypothetical protein